MSKKEHAEYLRRLLRKARITQSMAAEAVGVTDRMMRYYLNPGSRWRASEKTITTLEKLANVRSE